MKPIKEKKLFRFQEGKLVEEPIIAVRSLDGNYSYIIMFFENGVPVNGQIITDKAIQIGNVWIPEIDLQTIEEARGHHLKHYIQETIPEDSDGVLITGDHLSHFKEGYEHGFEDGARWREQR